MSGGYNAVRHTALAVAILAITSAAARADQKFMPEMHCDIPAPNGNSIFTTEQYMEAVLPYKWVMNGDFKFEIRYLYLNNSKCWIDFLYVLTRRTTTSDGKSLPAARSFSSAAGMEKNLMAMNTLFYSDDLYAFLKSLKPFNDCSGNYNGIIKHDKIEVANEKECKKKVLKDLDARGFVAGYSIPTENGGYDIKAFWVIDGKLTVSR